MEEAAALTTRHAGRRICPHGAYSSVVIIPHRRNAPWKVHHAGGLFVEKAERTLCCLFAAILRLANLASGSRLPALMLSRTLVEKERTALA